MRKKINRQSMQYGACGLSCKVVRFPVFCVTYSHILLGAFSRPAFTPAVHGLTPAQRGFLRLCLPMTSSLSVLARISLCCWFLLGAAAVPAQVFRCGSSYSNASCKGGQVVDTSPVLSDPRGPVTREIYLCSATPGRNYWSSVHCAERGWRIERIERVAAALPWDEQVAAASQAHRSALQAAAVPVQRQSQVSQPAARPASGTCVALEERVKALDSMGRAGSQYYDLDWVRRERKIARDQQYRQRC